MAGALNGIEHAVKHPKDCLMLKRWFSITSIQIEVCIQWTAWRLCPTWEKVCGSSFWQCLVLRWLLVVHGLIWLEWVMFCVMSDESPSLPLSSEWKSNAYAASWDGCPGWIMIFGLGYRMIPDLLHGALDEGQVITEHPDVWCFFGRGCGASQSFLWSCWEVLRAWVTCWTRFLIGIGDCICFPLMRNSQ